MEDDTSRRVGQWDLITGSLRGYGSATAYGVPAHGLPSVLSAYCDDDAIADKSLVKFERGYDVHVSVNWAELVQRIRLCVMKEMP